MTTDAVERFACFGGICEVRVGGPGGATAAARARVQLLAWHRRFTRFDPASELARLNDDPRAAVPARPTMLALADAIGQAGALTGGLVDATLAPAALAPGDAAPAGPAAPPARCEAAPRAGLPLPLALKLAPRRRPAQPSPTAGWRAVRADHAAGAVHRPPGIALDSGGLAKGLFADLIADELATFPSFVVDCAGDLRIGGRRRVDVRGPGGDVVHALVLAGGGVATSGISRRSWLDDRGRPAHHLLDPATSRPAFTGVVQATAVAPTALEAEARAKAALLAGPAGAAGWLPHGGVLVLDDGRVLSG
jgi:thiamine biosynthesis lipoprotein